MTKSDNYEYANTPVPYIIVDGLLQDEQALAKLAIDIENQLDPKMNNTTQVKAPMSSYYIKPTPSIYRVVQKTEEIARKFAFVHCNGLNPGFVNYNVWGMVYRKGHYADSHQHWPGALSWVYYVQADSDHPPLVLSEENVEIEAKTDRIVMFGSWMIHHVPEQTVDKPRIAMSGNMQGRYLMPWPMMHR